MNEEMIIKVNVIFLNLIYLILIIFLNMKDLKDNIKQIKTDLNKINEKIEFYENLNFSLIADFASCNDKSINLVCLAIMF